MRATFDLDDDSFELYRRQLNQFVINHDLRWKKKSKFRKNHFEKEYGSWLQQEFLLKSPHKKKELKPLDLCSERTKKRRAAMREEKAENGESGSTAVPTKKQNSEDASAV